MTILDVTMECTDLVWSWQVDVCVIPAVLIASLLHDLSVMTHPAASEESAWRN